jgi:6-phosphofructokinase
LAGYQRGLLLQQDTWATRKGGKNMKTWTVVKCKDDELQEALQNLEDAGATIFAVVGGEEKLRMRFVIVSYTEG